MATWQHLRSSTANKRPTTSLADGRIAINTNTASPGLFFKDSAGTGIVKVGPVHVGTTAPNSVPAAGGSSGNYLGEQWLDTSVSPAQLKVWNGSTWVGVVADELPVSKLQDGAPRQLIQTDAAGTGVEWTSNVDVPGTLDVTGATTLDSTLSIQAGSAASPSVFFSGDANTGIYSPGADQVAISTNGARRLLISNGQIQADTLFSVAMGGVGFQTIFRNGANEDNYITHGASGFTAFRNHNGSEYMRLDSSGRLGVGTSSPGFPLQVHGAISFGDKSPNTGGQGSIYNEGNNINIEAFSASNVSTKRNINLAPYGGNVGVGTTAPSNQLTVGSNGTSSITLDWIGDNLPKATFSANHATGEVRIGATNNSGAYFTTFYSNNNEAVRIDSSRRLLVGTSSSSATLTSLLQGNSGGTSNAGILHLAVGATTPADGSNCGRIHFSDSNHTTAASIAAQRDGGTWTSNTSMPTRLVFSTTADGASSPTERMRIINNGQILLNTSNSTAIHAARSIVFTLEQNGDIAINHSTANSSGDAFARFGYNGTQIGGITQNGTTAVAYNTSSDYRLKENVTAVTDGITRLQQLKPARFNFIADPDTVVDGFIAHEVQDVVPEAITGEKDAVDDEGNPEYQGIDQSKLVPLLTAALQEAVAKIESLEARLTAAGI